MPNSREAPHDCHGARLYPVLEFSGHSNALPGSLLGGVIAVDETKDNGFVYRNKRISDYKKLCRCKSGTDFKILVTSKSL